MKVVIAQCDDHIVTTLIKPPQCGEIVGASIDDIADGPQGVLVLIDPYLLEQAVKGLETTLNISDDIGGHEYPPLKALHTKIVTVFLYL